MSEQVRKAGRPRTWASDAERKRAYRQRRAAELADPLELREIARAARVQAAEKASEADAARREAERWRAKAHAAERRAQGAEDRAAKAKQAAQRAFRERDDARRLLRRKLQWAGQADALRNDPDALVALVAELNEDRARLRKEMASARRELQYPAAPRW